jgi:hypothetical protein
MDAAKIRSETVRWKVLLTLHNGAPFGALEKMALSVVQSYYPDETLEELRHDFDYLEGLALINFYVMPHGRPDRRCYKLTANGSAYVAGAPLVETGIARPSPIKRARKPTSKREVKHPLTTATISINT